MNGTPVSVASSSQNARAELRMRVDAGADRGAALRAARSRRGSTAASARIAALDLRAPAGELLPERHRHRIHQVRAAGLDDARRPRAPSRAATSRRCSSAGSSSRAHGERRADVDRGRDHVVAALAHVDVIVRDAPACRGAAWRACAITSLAFMLVLVPEPVWNTSIGKLRVVPAGGHLRRRRIDRRRDSRFEQLAGACWRAPRPA